MPDTATLDIPFPGGTDDADIPSDMQAMAERVETLMLRSGEIATHTPAPGDEAKLVICQADGALAYRVMQGDASIDADGNVLIADDSLDGSELQDDAVGQRAIDIEDILPLLVPAGTIWATGASAAPSGWLLCDGSSKLRSDFGGLFTAIGTAYGSVDGTHFNVPDLRGRTPVGVDGTAGRLSANDALGNNGGEERHTLNQLEMPAHAHNVTPIAVNGAGGGNFAVGGGLGVSNVNTSTTGSSQDHNNMQPFLVVNFMIRT